jgi:hypothetical protein
MDIENVNNYLSTEEYNIESEIFIKSDDFINFQNFLKRIPINTKYYNNSNKYNATYAQLYKRKQGSNIEACTKRMNITLNKLTNINHDAIVKDCNEMILECSEIVPKMIESIFLKCSSQHSLCKNYIELLIKLPQKDIKQVVQRKVDLYMKQIIETNEDKVDSNESYDDFCSRLKEKSMFHGYSLFLTHLHNKNYIDINYINNIMDILVERLQDSEENSETLVQALYAISMNIDSVDKLEAYIPLLQEQIDNDILSMKLQFKIQDIMDRFNVN